MSKDYHWESRGNGLWSLLVFGQADSKDYTASVQLQIDQDGDGTSGKLHSLSAKQGQEMGFYRWLGRRGLEPFYEIGLRCVTADVRQAHLRLILHRLEPIARVEITGTKTIAGAALQTIVIRPLAPPETPTPPTTGRH